MELFTSLENSGLATWVREGSALWAFDVILIAHALGMAALVGLSAAIYLRVLGFAPSLPLAPMEGFYPLMWAGFYVNLVSGVLLFIGYPVRAVVAPGFYVKMGGVALSIVFLRRLRRQVFGNPAYLDTRPVPTNGKILAGAALFIWLVTITAGRLMGYSDVPMIQPRTYVATSIITVVLLVGGLIALRLWGGDKQLRQGV